jgi:predicted transcriptional regulator
MRTTIDLPPAAHQRVRELAASRHQSMSAVVVDLALRGLAQLDDVVVEYSRDAVSGLPTISVGQQISPDDVAAALDDE